MFGHRCHDCCKRRPYKTRTLIHWMNECWLIGNCPRFEIPLPMIGVQMSLSLQQIKDELRESYLRTEQVLSGMDAYIIKLEKRVETLEGQLATIVADLDDDGQAPQTPAPKIIVAGRS